MTRNRPTQTVAVPAPPITSAALEPAAPHWEALLVCPACGVGLKQSHDKLRCEPCRKEWPVIDGVPVFAERFPYWGEIPWGPMLKVNALIQDKYWKKVLLESEDTLVRQA